MFTAEEEAVLRRNWAKHFLQSIIDPDNDLQSALAWLISELKGEGTTQVEEEFLQQWLTEANKRTKGAHAISTWLGLMVTDIQKVDWGVHTFFVLKLFAVWQYMHYE